MASVMSFAVGCGGASYNDDNGGVTVKYDKRNLTPQEYSVANLTAVDDYGRTVTVKDPSSEKKYLGMFYFAWLGNQGASGGTYDVTKLQRENPDALRPTRPIRPHGSSTSTANRFTVIIL